jgi:ribose 1,5-bisphosphokinase
MGQLFYLMGASGVGKDSLLFYLQSHLAATDKVMLPRRYITRESHAGGEPHIEITQAEFQRHLGEGRFAMHWYSHGYAYGIGIEIEEWLEQGFQVVINGSRHYLESARESYPDLLPVLVTVSHDQLAQRLISRGRENREQIEQRLLRAEALDLSLKDSNLIRLSNDGPLQEAGNSLLKLILSKADNPSSNVGGKRVNLA